MQQNDVKVGDVVAWDKVPSGALARDYAGDYALRVNDKGHFVGLSDGAWESWDEMDGHHRAWGWDGHTGDATIIALDLTGQETAAELQRLAEVFEVREAWTVAASIAMAER